MNQTYPKQQTCSLMEVNTSKFTWSWSLQLRAENKEKPSPAGDGHSRFAHTGSLMAPAGQAKRSQAQRPGLTRTCTECLQFGSQSHGQEVSYCKDDCQVFKSQQEAKGGG